MNVKLTPTGIASPSNGSAASVSTSGSEKSATEIKLEKKPGIWSRLRSLSEGCIRAAGLGKARKHAESAVPKARFAPIKQRSPEARTVGISVPSPVTEAQSRPKRTSFGKPPAEPPPMPPQAPPTAQPSQTLSKSSVQVPRAWKNATKTAPTEAPPMPPSQPSALPVGDQGLTGKMNGASGLPSDDDLDSALDSALHALNDAGSSGADPASRADDHGNGGARPVAPDKDAASSLDEIDALLNEMNSALALEKALKELESPASSPGQRT